VTDSLDATCLSMSAAGTAYKLRARKGTEFVTADKFDPDAATSLAAAPAANSADSPLVVSAEINLEDAKRVWNQFLELKSFLLEDPACFDVIAGRKEMNRTGATRLALPFGLSMEEREISESRVEDADTHEIDYRFIVRVRASKGGRFADGIGSCRLSEIEAVTKKGEPIPISQREHFALTRASTRARKRAIADILGGTEAE
jgi:hypothetical protein